jgi:hypothetical protein
LIRQSFAFLVLRLFCVFRFALMGHRTNTAKINNVNRNTKWTSASKGMLCFTCKPINLWLAFHITMDNVTTRPSITGHNVYKHCLYDTNLPTKITIYSIYIIFIFAIFCHMQLFKLFLPWPWLLRDIGRQPGV